MMEQSDNEALPLFCVKTNEKKTGQILYLNFRTSATIAEPELDIEEAQLIQEICNPSPRIEQYKIPLRLSQIFWQRVAEDNVTRKDYVIDVELNDKFALRRVIISEIIRNYVITVAMISIEEKFNQVGSNKVTQQYIGHKLELDQNNYETLELEQQMKRLQEPVSNKILLVNSSTTGKSEKEFSVGESSSLDASEQIYDLFVRPKSQILTCSIHTETCPDSISFNDDRIRVESGSKTLMDVFLPVDIDLNEPAKYKFDDRIGLFRLVFKLANL